MKITTERTTIETNAEELSRSNSLADSFSQLLRRCLNGGGYWGYLKEDEEEGEEEE